MEAREQEAIRATQHSRRLGRQSVPRVVPEQSESVSLG